MGIKTLRQFGERDGMDRKDLESGMPLVSVIIPTYNRIATLPRSIDSVLNQTFANLELIVVDDGSTDGTQEYVRGLSDARVRYVRGDGNRGPAAARNLGVRLAQGEYIAFQDSDDEWHADKLEKQMPILLDTRQDNGMVYCEFARYHGQRKQEVVPSKRIPANCKQGNIQPVLLLQPLIGTPTMVIKKKYFIQAGGFNEGLKTFEDYEFTVRFSQCHRIGFVEEPLVKVNDLPDSIDKRYADRIRTQAYIVREMIGPLREHGILWDKLSAVQEAAEHLKCHDVFLEELQKLEDLFATQQDRDNAAILAEKTQQSDAKQNQLKEMAYEALVTAKQRLVEAYVSIYREEAAGNAELDKVIRQTQSSVSDCRKCFEMPPALHQACDQVYAVRVPAARLECLSLLADVVKTVEDLEKWMEQQIIECNICSSAFFKNETHRCPYCEAEDGERLLIAFLQELQPQAGETLNMLQMMPSRRMRNYALNRMDIRCENLETGAENVHVLQGLAGEEYDILTCPVFSKQPDYDSSVWREIFRIMKPGGICLVSPHSGGGVQEAGKWLEPLGFYVNVVGEDWFGEDFYRAYGFDSQMIILALTKDRALAEI